MADTPKVEALDRFGRALDDFPKEVMARQVRIMLRELAYEVGSFGVPRLLTETMWERRQVKREHPEAMELLDKWGTRAVNEALMLVSLFNVLARRSDREHARSVVRSIFTKIAPHSMAALYQLEDLVRCDGDRFINFKKFHLALFNASQHLFPNTQTAGTDSFTSSVTRCSNVEVFTALGCPELTTLGCDHDIAGYPAISDEVDAVFRRPCTIARGSETCEFRFYRRGTEPATEVIDGVTIPWEESLSR